MFAQQRYNDILDTLNKNGSVKVSALIKRFGVSFETVRRDLEYLEKEGYLKRVHGGAVLDEVNSVELPFTMRETKHATEKKEIAELATRFVTEGQSIAMDVSTTNTELAKAFKKKFERLTVVTNSLPIANELAEMPNYTIILAGGVLRNNELCLVGEMAEKFISQFYIDTFFMSISGVSLIQGLTDYGFGEVNLKSQMLKQTQKTIVLADSSKFDVVSLMKVCEIDQVDSIITDSKLSEKIRDKYLKNGIEIINE